MLVCHSIPCGIRTALLLMVTPFPYTWENIYFDYFDIYSCFVLQSAF